MRVTLVLLLVELAAYPGVAAGMPSAQSVLRAAEREMGRFPPAATIEALGTIDAEGRSGEFRETVRMRDGAFGSSARYHLFTDSDGYNGRVRWRQDRSGASHALNAPFSRADAISLAWLKRRGYFDLLNAHVEGVGHEQIDDRPATVLTLRPRGGNAIRFAFDDARHLLVRVQRERPLNIVTETYGDYRQVGGAKVPFKIDVEDGGDHELIHVTAYQRLGSRGDRRFSPPAPPKDMVMTGPATLPLASLSFAVVPATINGRTYDFILDTGGHNIVTPEVAAELGLTSGGHGTSGGSGPGREATSDTMIGELKLGSATITNQHFTVLNLGNAVKRKDKPPMAGILGLEIFERMAVTVDEPRNQLTITPFDQVGRCNGDRIPLLFDDDQPSVAGKIDGITALIGIDVGNGGIPIVLWRWAEAQKVADRFRNGKEGSGSGVGGNNTTFRTSHHHVTIGRATLSDTDVNYATTPSGYFSSRTDSMNLGRTLLQNYAVRLDYRAGEMCVIKPAS